jgi:hypothetical protein
MMRIAFAVFVGLALAGSGAWAACPSVPAKPHTAKQRAQAERCAHQVNLGQVPEISANVVASEPAAAIKAPSYIDPKSAGYEGPTLNLTKPEPGVRPVPTVGYHWSLE